MTQQFGQQVNHADQNLADVVEQQLLADVADLSTRVATLENQVAHLQERLAFLASKLVFDAAGNLNLPAGLAVATDINLTGDLILG